MTQLVKASNITLLLKSNFRIMRSYKTRIDTSSPETLKKLNQIKIENNFNTISKCLAFIIGDYSRLKNENINLKKQLQIMR